MKTKHTDFLIIGSGIAGLRAALELSQWGTVTIVTKASIKESATEWAQGGIAAAMHHKDTPALHLQDTLSAGAKLCNEDAVRILVEEGPLCVTELIELGAQFDQTTHGYDYTKEAAHSQRRILHASDTTGKEIKKTLGNALLKKNIQFYEHTMASQLLLNTNNDCIGTAVITNTTESHIYANATLIATGGCGQVFSKTTTPAIATGDGTALAYHIGCTVQDMEFIQFHPTTLTMGDKKPISIFLISEAVRGEGAVLRNISGHRFMLNYHPKAELAPRDIVARSIYLETQKTKNHVFLDLSPIKDIAKKRFPTIYKRCLNAGIDITRDFIPVSPAAHYCMGGIKTTTSGETSIPRLFAAGEVASLGIHGANRLASNSLLDGLVFGKRAALQMSKLHPLTSHTLQTHHAPKTTTPTDIKSRIIGVKQTIRSTMWRYVSIIRKKDELVMALNTLNTLNWILELSPIEPELIEVQNLLINAMLITKAAYNRKESRGAHYRSDFSDTVPEYETHLVFSK
jgi:L-aspartate oxidase